MLVGKLPEYPKICYSMLYFRDLFDFLEVLKKEKERKRVAKSSTNIEYPAIQLPHT